MTKRKPPRSGGLVPSSQTARSAPDSGWELQHLAGPFPKGGLKIEGMEGRPVEHRVGGGHGDSDDLR